MPKLGRYAPILDTVFFLYPTRDDAQAGIGSGGTGFLVAVPSEKWPGHFHVHAVTNWHVVESAPCIRLNTHLGISEIIEFESNEWIFESDGNDIAVSPPLKIKKQINKQSFLDINSFFLTPEQELQDEIGPADDVFMVGRFVDYDGIETNVPACRFGHISIMDAKIVQDQTGFLGRSILLDMNSRTGFSGSPVFIFRTLGSHFLDEPQPGQFLTGGGSYMKLLGIHWGQFPEIWELENPYVSKSITHNASLVTDGAYVKGFSGMTCVIPAVCIVKLLKSAKVEVHRTDTNYHIS